MIYFKSIETIISEPQLMEMEKKLQVSFPKDYKNFLLKHNVATPEEQYMSILIEELNEPVLFRVMLGFSDNENFCLVDWNLEYRNELPEHSLIFATEYGGGLFVMIIEGENKGIYFWDHSFIFEQSSEDSNVYFLAASFTDFISKLSIV